MKTQRALRLRSNGKHHATPGAGAQPWIRTVWNSLSRAFEMNAVPKHSNEGPPNHPYVTMDYVTGAWTWQGPAIIHPHTFVDMALENLERGSETS